MTIFTISLCTRKPTPCSCLSSFSLKYTVTPIGWDFSRLFPSHLTQSKMLHLFRSISCKSPFTLPAALRVLTFHVAMVMSSLPRSLAPVAHLSFPPWFRRETRSLCRAATDPVWIFYHSLLSLVVCLGHIFSPAMPTPVCRFV